MKIKEIAQTIANNANMPYVWEDVLNRLKDGKALPFKLKDRQPINKKLNPKQAKPCIYRCHDCNKSDFCDLLCDDYTPEE